MIRALQIDSNSVCKECAVLLALEIPLAGLRNARRTGELRFVRRVRRVFVLGKYLLAWLDPANSDPAKESEVARAS